MINSKEFAEKNVQIILNKLKIGKFDDVITKTKSLIKKFPNYFVLYNILSIAYQSKNECEKSIYILKNALKLNPKNIHFLNNMGLSYYKLGNLIESEKYFKRIFEIEPNFLVAINNMANLKKDLNLENDALNLYEKALKIDKNNSTIHFNLGSIYQSLGDFEKSKNHYKESLKISPEFTKSDFNISLMSKYNKNHEHFLNMKEKLNLKLDDLQKSYLLFALGKAFEDFGDYKNAFINFKNANDLKNNLIKYDFKKDEKLFNEIKKIFSKNSKKKLSPNKKKIIFIVGLPRSGTSLVEQIIASHKNVYGGGELNTLTQTIRRNLYEQDMLNIKDINNDNYFEKLSKMQDEYIEYISYIDNSSKSFTDKAPLNFRWIGFIKVFLPNSKIIHCTRNKMGGCWSIFKNTFDGGVNFGYNLKFLAKYHNIYSDLMNFYNKNFPNDIYNISYENLVSNQNEEIKKLIDFCELDWDTKCLEFYKNKKSIKTVSFAQARKPIYNSSVKSWENYSSYLDVLKENLNNV